MGEYSCKKVGGVPDEFEVELSWGWGGWDVEGGKPDSKRVCELVEEWEGVEPDELVSERGVHDIDIARVCPVGVVPGREDETSARAVDGCHEHV